MNRELTFGLRAMRRRPTAVLAAWSVPEVLPTLFFGLAVAHATDAFLAGRTTLGLAWLGGLIAAAGLGAIGASQVYRRLGELVEPFRDTLVQRVVDGALANGIRGARDDGAVARLNRQVELVRDTYAGLILVVRNFLVTVTGVVTGLLSLAPVIAVFVLPPFLLGFGLSLAILGLAAGRIRASIRADEDLAVTAGMTFAGIRDVTAAGAGDYAAGLVGLPIEAHARAERNLAKVAALRTLCFAVGGWLPLLVLLGAAPWLIDRGVSTGTLLGGLTYVLLGLQPALGTMLSALGDSGLRYVVTLGRILDTSATPSAEEPAHEPPRGHVVRLSKVSFAYGPEAEPVLDKLDLVIPENDHLAVVGPSGIGKSTLAALICGLLPPTGGRIQLGGVPAVQAGPKTRVLIPQEAYVFSGTVLDNLTYLHRSATLAEVEAAIEAVGATALVRRLGGLAARVRPGPLSPGERQLIALTRAYLSPAPLVILDEATCHLDPEAERQAEEAFAARQGSLVVIAHRVSSALRARRVLVLDGRHPAVGTHQGLLRESQLYRELVGHWQDGDQIQPAS
ncbi:ATP-binding cassette domain-containing protein [Kribbella deserti]|uniref:ATP-binding cassette domain-containing protein n=1 Tax=Kribbella deserti TaxID=1926257 RepID=A0ABV6QQV8_9ACTN